MAVPGRKAVKDTASGESFEFVCGPCSIDGINLQAAGYCADCGEYLCVSCFTCHLKPLPCRHHVLLDTNTMPKDKQLTNVSDICTERCPTHFGKLLEFFCPVHEHLGCNVCMTINHRSCEDVAFIADEVNDIYTSDGYVSFKMKLAGIEASIADNRKINKEHESEAETIQNRAMDNAKAFRKDINAFLDKLEAATETRVKHLNNQNIASTKQVFERCASLDAKLQSLVSNINSKQSLNQKCNLFVAMKRAKGSVESYEEEAKAISCDNEIKRYVFQPEKEILTILKTAADFGELTIFKVKTKPNAKGSGGKDRSVDFCGLEAVEIEYFFKEVIKDMEDLVSREQKPEERITISYALKKAGTVDKTLEELRAKLNALNREELAFGNGYTKKVTGFVEKNKKHPNLLYYVDYKCRKVYVVGDDYTIVQEGLHKLKVHLGLVKPIGRLARQLSDPANIQRKETPDFSNSLEVHAGKGSHSNTRHSEVRSTGSPRKFKQGSGYGVDDFRFEARLKNGFILKVYKASITRLNVDTIVNASNDTLTHEEGVARVIATAAGSELEKDSRDYIERHGLLKVSGNCITSAGNMPYKSVIHAVGPQWYHYKDKVHCVDVLYNTVMNILILCEKEDYHSVGMSAISAGIYGVPKELCADIYVKAAVDFCENGRRNPKELHITDVDISLLKLVEASFKKWEMDPFSVKQSVSNYLKLHPEVSSGGGNYGASYGRDDRGQIQFDHDDIHPTGKGRGREIDIGRQKYDHSLRKSFKLACTVSKQAQQSFKWGGKAEVFKVDGKIIVKIFNGSVDKVGHLDAIVCGTDTSLQSRGFIADALKKAGGPKYQIEVQDMGKKSYTAKRNDVFKCGAGNLKVNYVMHVVVGRVSQADTLELEEYQEGVFSVLKKANNWSFRRLAIPLIGTGSIQADSRKLKLCCRAFLAAICDFCSKYGDNQISELHLVNNADMICTTLVRVFSEASGDYGNNTNQATGN